MLYLWRSDIQSLTLTSQPASSSVVRTEDAVVSEQAKAVKLEVRESRLDSLIKYEHSMHYKTWEVVIILLGGNVKLRRNSRW